jgi:putative membrane protein
MSKLFALGSLAALALLVAGFAFADDKKIDTPTSDADFLAKAVACCTGDVKASELAAKQATNPKVKEYAEKIVKDHKKVSDQLMDQAKTLKVPVATDLDKAQKDRYDALSKLKGNDFDRDYMTWMIEDHEKAIAACEFEAKNGKQDTLRDFAKTNLGELKKHLEDAKKIRDELK